ncbi:MAG: PKD domain-containing protein [Bacteroidales bacterium]|nr:PKD domain-containing protein [Bacteroidales bacterium]
MKFFISLLLAVTFSINFLCSQTTLVLQPGPEDGKDTRLNSLEEYTGGTQEEFMAAAWTYQGRPATDRSTIAFNLDTILAGSTILNATLSLYGPPGLVSGGHSTLYGSNEAWLLRIISEWDEHSVTWTTQPSTTLQNRVYVPESTKPFEDYELDVTNLVQDMIDDPENSFGFMFKLETEIYYRRLNFASSDHLDPTKRPKLKITFFESTLLADFTYTIENLIVQFANLSQHADSYLWDFGDGIISEDENPIHQYTESGEYEVTLIAYNDATSDTITKTLIVYKLPISAFDFSIDDLTLFFINLSQNADSYLWNFGDGIMSENENPTHQYTESGEYDVTLIAYNDFTSDTITKTLTVCKMPISAFDFSIDDFTLFFTNLSLNADTYFWTFGDGNLSILENPIYTYSIEGKYIVSLVATNACGEDTLNKSVIICKLPIANFEYKQTTGYEVSFINKSLEYESCYWYFGDGSGSFDQDPTHIYNQPGNYTIKLIIDNYCGSDTLLTIIYVSPLPIADFTYDVIGQKVILNNHSENADSYIWYLGDGETCNTFETSHVYSKAGDYAITLIASNDYGSDMQTKLLTISVDRPYKERSFIIYPNPTHGLLTIKLINIDPIDAIIDLFNYRGKFIKSYALFIDGESTIDLSEFPSGIYTLKLKSDLLNNRIKKVVKLF